LAASTLWLTTVYLAREKRNFWVSLIPALFMTAVVVSYILAAPEGFKLPSVVSNAAGVSFAVALALWFFYKFNPKKQIG
jgi:carbon starvation protein CstA